MTFSGQPRRIELDKTNPMISEFEHQIEHVIVSDMPDTNNAWDREAWQRKSIIRGLPNAAPATTSF